jgi:hypothetical protein
MADGVTDVGGVPVLLCDPQGPPVATESDALELIGEAMAAGVEWVAVPAARLDPAYFRLSSGVAGAIVQKFTAYRRRLAVLGEDAPTTAGSASWRAFVVEANRGDWLWLLPDLAALSARLAPTGTEPPGAAPSPS